MLNEWTIQGDPEDFLRVIGNDVLARQETPDTTRSGAPSYATDRPILWHYSGNLTLAGTAITLGVKSWNLKTKNNMDKERFFMSNLLSRPKRAGRRMVEGQVVTEFEDLTLYNKYLNETEGAFDITYTSTEEVVAGEPYAIKIETDAGTSRLVGETPNEGSEAPVEVTYNFRLLDESAEFKITLCNADATYA